MSLHKFIEKICLVQQFLIQKFQIYIYLEFICSTFAYNSLGYNWLWAIIILYVYNYIRHHRRISRTFWWKLDFRVSWWHGMICKTCVPNRAVGSHSNKRNGTSDRGDSRRERDRTRQKWECKWPVGMPISDWNRIWAWDDFDCTVNCQHFALTETNHVRHFLCTVLSRILAPIISLNQNFNSYMHSKRERELLVLCDKFL